MEKENTNCKFDRYGCTNAECKEHYPVKDTLSSLLTEIEGRKRKTDLSLMELSQANDSGYNQAIDSVLSLIRSKLQ